MLWTPRHSSSSSIHLLVDKIDQIAHVRTVVKLDPFLLGEEGRFVWTVSWTTHLTH